MHEEILIAFYGGTFDPIHYGHLKSVIALSQFIKLQKVIFLLNQFPAHRPQPVASFQQRLMSIRLAISELSDSLFYLDKSECREEMPSYIVETFELLRSKYGSSIPLAFILGEDSLLTLPQWHRGLELLTLCHLLVCTRPGYDNWRVSYVNNKRWLNNRLTFDPQLIYKQPAGLIYCAPTPKLPISSSQIRERYRHGRSCRGLLPSSVQDYIDSQRLYR
ncbi:nicotinate/nicotinamide nucleotide adenylyltransferase [secondary endosymbiont of Heteropsylla cubana]|uniref:Probable nicotinate-nucleotide adenylyltransferase n=1 Tax=secondary endosymbiont of Heteropsylla cubana TaxID=134287 RepID=J3YT40_9ENTR|nr:nicotinate-nucleotide adenylyltransferase [secondary endosymbiont of Heteropsylla cubana]AFP85578.1 nicotinate/nicotinamide nucleotide adenylyltransferase [secondary endosymbiont of Heteropsylla cubana]